MSDYTSNPHLNPPAKPPPGQSRLLTAPNTSAASRACLLSISHRSREKNLLKPRNGAIRFDIEYQPHSESNDYVDGFGYFDPEGNRLAVGPALKRGVREQWENHEAKVSVCIEGEYVKVVKRHARRVGHKAKSKRGDVQGYSKKSRRRFMHTMGKLKMDKKPIWVDLTIPDGVDYSPKAVNGYRDAFGKRLLRRFPKASIIWRREYQDRKSGVDLGTLKPHYHCFVFGVDRANLRAWVPQNWYEVVGSGNQDHLKAGTSVKRLKSRRQAMYYASKYMAKEVEQAMPKGAGRCWGMIGRENIPWSAVFEVPIHYRSAERIVRTIRKYLGLSGKNLRYGVSLLINPDTAINLIELFDMPLEQDVLIPPGPSLGTTMVAGSGV